MMNNETLQQEPIVTTTEQEQQVPPAVDPQTEELIRAAKIAKGELQPEKEHENIAYRFIAAKKDVSSSGRVRQLWYRMRRSPGTDTWEYYAEGRLPKGNYYANERQATVYGNLYIGDLVATHDHAKPIDRICLVYYNLEENKAKLHDCEFAIVRGNQLQISLPDGSKITLPNPRK